MHWVGPTGYGDLLAAVAATRPPLVVITNEAKAVAAVKASSPETFVVFRITGRDVVPDPSYEAGVARASELLPSWRGIGANAYSLANEWESNDDATQLRQLSDTYRGMMDVANSLGMKVTVGDFSTGRPKIESLDCLDAIRPMVAQAENDHHYLNIHIYPMGGDPYRDKQYHILRFAPVFEQYSNLKVVVGEYAPDTGGSHPALLSGADDLLRPYNNIIGLALFTLGVGWENFRVDLAAYERHVRAR